MNIKEIKLLDTKKKKIIAGAIAGILLVGGIGIYALTGNNGDLILAEDKITAELGQTVSTDVADYLNYNKVDSKKAEKIIKDTKSKNNFKYVTVENKDENGNVISKEEKDYPKVGEYKLIFTYKDEKETVEVTVKDTIKPKITAPDTIDVIQFTDLSTFNFAELLQVTDYSDVKDWKIDTSKVDINTIGTYDLKVSISDVEKNKATKKMKINVVESPTLSDGEIAVTEIITDENGKKKTVVTKKSSDSITAKDNVSTGKKVDNKGNVSTGSGSSATKPTTPSGSTSGNNKPSKPDNGNTGNNKPSHSHNWVAVTKTVHHPAETKTVHHDAVTKTETVTVVDKPAWDEPIYEKHYVCKKCGYDSGKDVEAMGDHIIYDCNGSYTYTNVQIGTKHHDAITHQEQKTVVVKPAWDETVVVKEAYDETIITGYKCSCGATKSK